MLFYESAAKVGVSAAKAIRAEAAAVERAWWNGGVGFDGDDPAAPEILKGETPLFRPGVPLEDDLFMSFGDMAAIVELLGGWAARFGVKWRLKMDDEDWGAIDPTGPSQVLLDQLKKWSRRAKVPEAGKAKWMIPDTRRRDISSRHPR